MRYVCGIDPPRHQKDADCYASKYRDNRTAARASWQQSYSFVSIALLAFFGYTDIAYAGRVVASLRAKAATQTKAATQPS